MSTIVLPAMSFGSKPMTKSSSTTPVHEPVSETPMTRSKSDNRLNQYKLEHFSKVFDKLGLDRTPEDSILVVAAKETKARRKSSMD